MSRVASPTRESSGTVLLRKLTTLTETQRPPTRFTHLSGRHSEEGEKGPPADPLSTLARVEQPQPCGLLPGWAPWSPSCAPPSGYSATPSRPMWVSSPTPDAQPLPHSLWKLCVLCTDFLLTALDLPFGPASSLVPPPASGAALDWPLLAWLIPRPYGRCSSEGMS